jgi:hypothetical protein
VRSFYNLEEIWGGKEIGLHKAAPKRASPKKKKAKSAKSRAKAARPRRKR